MLTRPKPSCEGQLIRGGDSQEAFVSWSRLKSSSLVQANAYPDGTSFLSPPMPPLIPSLNFTEASDSEPLFLMFREVTECEDTLLIKVV